MKVVSVMTGAAPGGAEFASVELLDALVARGHTATMLSDIPEIGCDSSVEVHALDLGPKLSSRSWPELARRWALLRRRLRAALEAVHPYDVLLLHYKKEQLLAPWLPVRLRPQVVWAEWGPVPRQLRRGIGRRAYASAARSASLVLAVSEGTRRSAIEAGVDAEKAFVLPNAIRTDEIAYSEAGRARLRKELGIPQGAFTVGCVSRFHPKKRNDTVIDAVTTLGGDTHLILAGAGETEAELRARAEPLGGRAHFLPTPGDTVADVLSACDISVFCPSPTEGQPRAVILAMLAGRPCVSTGVEGVAEMIGDGCGAIVSPEHDAVALATILRSYESDPDRLQREGALAAQRARERFDAAVVAERAERLIYAAGSDR